MSFSLYVHLPFCVKKCAYCDFESHAGKLTEADAYIDAVLDEAATRKKEYGSDRLISAYFGGGTPSLLSAGQLTRLAGKLFEMFPPEEGAEITVEANPGTLTKAFLAAARRAGINRLSLGVQARQERLLKLLGRIHTFEEAAQSVRMAADAGFENISCDVMFTLPSQTRRDFSETLSAVCDLGIKHLSCYSLILEEGTPLCARVRSGELSLPGEEEDVRMQTDAVSYLEKRGFERYEISNYALPGYESRHNMVYWTGGDYLGLGCAAHSFMRGERFYNPDYEGYMHGARQLGRERISLSGRLEETVMLETRLTRGIDLKRFEHEYGSGARQKLVQNAGRFAKYVVVTPTHLRLNDEGLLLQNALVVELLNSIACKGV